MAFEDAATVIQGFRSGLKQPERGRKWAVWRPVFMGGINEINAPPSPQSHCDTLVVCIVQTAKSAPPNLKIRSFQAQLRGCGGPLETFAFRLFW